MALSTYVLTQNYRAPFVRITNNPRMPQQICYKNFKAGDMIKGELKHANNKPAFVLVQGTLVFPLSVIKAVVTKEVISDASGETKKEEAKGPVSNIIPVAKTPKIKYLDAAIIGGLIGLGAVYFAEKKGYLQVVDKKNKIYGAAIGALAGFYLIYRKTQNKISKPQTKE